MPYVPLTSLKLLSFLEISISIHISKNVFTVFIDPQNMSVDTVFVPLSVILTEL